MGQYPLQSSVVLYFVCSSRDGCFCTVLRSSSWVAKKKASKASVSTSRTYEASHQTRGKISECRSMFKKKLGPLIISIITVLPTIRLNKETRKSKEKRYYCDSNPAQTQRGASQLPAAPQPARRELLVASWRQGTSLQFVPKGLQQLLLKVALCFLPCSLCKWACLGALGCGA